MNRDIIYRPIGIIHTPFTERNETPPQPSLGRGVHGTVEIFPEFAGGLSDLDGFSHIILLFHLHRSEGYSLKLIPRLDTLERGVFATRAPHRPNPIGISIVRLRHIEGNTLLIEDIDMLDGTPLLDIKPYTTTSNPEGDVRIGWLEGKRDKTDAEGVDNTDIEE